MRVLSTVEAAFTHYDSFVEALKQLVKLRGTAGFCQLLNQVIGELEPGPSYNDL